MLLTCGVAVSEMRSHKLLIGRLAKTLLLNKMLYNSSLSIGARQVHCAQGSLAFISLTLNEDKVRGRLSEKVKNTNMNTSLLSKKLNF